LAELRDPRNNLHRFTYDELGRLIREEDPAGGFTMLSRTDDESGLCYTITKTEGVDAETVRVTTYRVENLPGGERRTVSVGCCGEPTTTVAYPDGRTVVTNPDGTVVETVQTGDPRFGMQAPLTKCLTMTTPGGLAYVQYNSREVELADPADPFSLVTLTDTVSINGRDYVSVYDAATRTIVNTTPEGRQSYTTLDEKGRAILIETPGLAPVGMTYDARGRLAAITEGTEAEARITTIVYNDQGYIESITDPLNRTTSFEYDGAGQVITEILPDSRRIYYNYDARSNITSITPPGKPAHTFTYTPVGLEETYNPPPVAGGGTYQTGYAYNLKK